MAALSDLHDKASSSYYKREFATIIEESIDDVENEGLAGCIDQYQSIVNSITMDSLKLDFTADQSTAVTNISEGLDPLRKLYIQKCNENIQLKHQVKMLKAKVSKRTKLDLSGLDVRNQNMFQNYTQSFD